jgi:hypothetical protein
MKASAVMPASYKYGSLRAVQRGRSVKAKRMSQASMRDLQPNDRQ